MRCIQLFCGLICVSFVYSVDPRVDPLVKIAQGLISGEKSEDGSYSTFLGIPYARVNVNNPFGVSSPFLKFLLILRIVKSIEFYICDHFYESVNHFNSRHRSQCLGPQKYLTHGMAL